MRKVAYIFLVGSLLCSCQLLTFDDGTSQVELQPVARVGEKFLLPGEVAVLTQGATSAQDSASIANRYIQSWIKRELLLKKAEEALFFNKEEIDLKVRDYRYALMIFEYKKEYISRNLDTLITEREIQEYYDSHLDNFLLKQNIIKGRFIQLSPDAPRVETVQNGIKSEDEEVLEELASYCIQFANSYNLNDSIWLNFEDVVLSTPYQSIPNKIQFLKRNKYAEASDSLYNYYLFVSDYKIQDQLSPLEFVKDQISKILINKRKVAMADQLEDNIMSEGLENQEYEIFN